MKKAKKITTLLLGTTLLAGLALGGCGTSTSAASNGDAELKLYQGMGQTSVFRARLDKETNKEAYSTSTVTASAVFDENDKVVSVEFDTLEITPEAHGEGGAVFAGWPGGAVTKDALTKDVENWQTKRERGDANYGMNWSEQIDSYQDFFKGKTVEEIEQWFAKSASDANGKPLTAEATDPQDVEKYNKLTDEEKEALADVTSGASISLKDAHGDFIGALKEAFENKKEISFTE